MQIHPDMMRWAEEMLERRKEQERARAAEASKALQAKTKQLNDAYSGQPKTMGQVLSEKA